MPPVWLKHGIHSALNLHDLSPATGLEGAAALDVKQSDRVITMHRHRIDPYAGAVSHISSSVSVQKRLARLQTADVSNGRVSAQMDLEIWIWLILLVTRTEFRSLPRLWR